MKNLLLNVVSTLVLAVLSHLLFGQSKNEGALFNEQSFREQMYSYSENNQTDSIRLICQQFIHAGYANTLKGWPHYYLAEASFQQGKLDSLEVIIEQAFQKFERFDRYEGIALIWNLRGLMAYSANRFDEAKKHFKRAFQISIEEQQLELTYKILQNQVLVCSRIQDHAASFMALKEALKVALDLGMTSEVLATYNQLATNYYSIGYLDSAIVYQARLIDFKKSSEMDIEWLSDLSLLGMLYNEQGDFVAAQRNLIEGLKLAEEIADTFYIMSFCTDIAETNATLSFWEDALEYSNRAIQLAQTKNMQLIEAKNLEIQALAFQKQKLIGPAIDQYLQALKIYESLNNIMGTADVLVAIGEIYEGQQNYNLASTYIERAIKSRKGTDNIIGMIEAQMLLGKLYIGTGKAKLAIPPLEDALSSGRQINNQNAQLRILGLLSDAYELKGDFKNAHAYYKQYDALEDSLSSLKTLAQVSEYKIKYKTEIKDEELSQRAKVITQKENQISRKNLQLFASGFLFISAFTLLLFLFYINQKNRELNRQKIEMLSKEKETQRLKAVIEGEERERKRIARDLHDELGALLATVKIRINTLVNHSPKLKESDNYQTTENLIDEACKTVREISHNMVPQVLEQQGLEQAIANRCDMISNSHNLQIEFIPHGLEQSLDNTMQVSIYRIVQELLSNVIKHAQAKEVIVQLTVEDENILLIVEDDGTGFDLKESSKKMGLGLDSIASRVTYLDGELNIDSKVGEGSTFTVHIPIPAFS